MRLTDLSGRPNPIQPTPANSIPPNPPKPSPHRIAPYQAAPHTPLQLAGEHSTPQHTPLRTHPPCQMCGLCTNVCADKSAECANWAHVEVTLLQPTPPHVTKRVPAQQHAMPSPHRLTSPEPTPPAPRHATSRATPHHRKLSNIPLHGTTQQRTTQPQHHTTTLTTTHHPSMPSNTALSRPSPPHLTPTLPHTILTHTTSLRPTRPAHLTRAQHHHTTPAHVYPTFAGVHCQSRFYARAVPKVVRPL